MRYPIKCHISNESGTTRVDVYDDIGGGSWYSNGISAADFAATMAAVRGPLEVHINSGGGVVGDGIAIMNAIRAHKGPVTTVVDGMAASIASVIVQAGRERVMQPGSMLMIHDAYTAFEGNAADMVKMAGTLDEHSNNLAGIYAARAGGTAESWRDRMRAETWYTADKAVAAGLADRVDGAGAVVPAGFDLAAYHMPSQIAAALRALPVARTRAVRPVAMLDGRLAGAIRAIVRDELRNDAVSSHPPMTGTHSHGHYDGTDGDHTHDHSHDGDAVHDHAHYDPDNDGDDDSSATGDTDHDYVLPDGSPGPKAWYAYPLRNADKYDTDDRKRMASGGQAMPDGSYPIADAEDLDNAIHAVGRGGADHDTIRRHIIKRAGALGLSSQIPDNWNSDGSLNTSAGDSLAATFLALVRHTPARAGKE
jgi:ATP-dependent protease ClpP protease subunit